MTPSRYLPLLLLLVATTASAVSFDCKYARSRSEILVCSDAELSSLDDALAVLYRRALAASANKADFRRRSENEWKRRESFCADKACVLDWYGQRKAQLLADLQPEPAASKPAKQADALSAGAQGASKPAPNSPSDGDLARCVASKAGAGRFTPLDGGRSARSLLVACQTQSQAWVDRCVTRGQTRDDCSFQVATVALDTLKSIQK